MFNRFSHIKRLFARKKGHSIPFSVIHAPNDALAEIRAEAGIRSNPCLLLFSRKVSDVITPLLSLPDTKKALHDNVAEGSLYSVFNQEVRHLESIVNFARKRQGGEHKPFKLDRTEYKKIKDELQEVEFKELIKEGWVDDVMTLRIICALRKVTPSNKSEVREYLKEYERRLFLPIDNIQHLEDLADYLSALVKLKKGEIKMSGLLSASDSPDFIENITAERKKIVQLEKDITALRDKIPYSTLILLDYIHLFNVMSDEEAQRFTKFKDYKE